MRKHLKKAVSFMMAVCLLAGNSYVDTRANTSVTMTEWVEEVPESSDAGTEVAETEKVSETASAEETKAAPVNTVFSYLDNSFKTLGMEELINPKVRIASAEDENNNQTAETSYSYAFYDPADSNVILSDGQEVVLEGDSLTLTVTRVGADGRPVMFPSNVTVTLTSNNNEVVSIIPNATQQYSGTVKREGPGYGLVTAVVSDPNIEQVFIITCYVKVGLLIEKDLDTEWKKYSQNSEDSILVLNQPSTYDMKLKYVDDKRIEGKEVSWSWTGEGVISITEEGKIIPEGAGLSTVTITTDTTSGSKPIKESFDVIVMPEGGTTLDATAGSYISKVPLPTTEEEFFIYSNGNPASNMEWEVEQILFDGNLEVEKVKISPSDTSLMSYTISEENGSIEFKNVKAGTYRVTGYATKNSKYVENSWAKVQYDIVVGFNLKDMNPTISMSVDDVYSIIANSNIPEGRFSELFDTRVPNIDEVGVVTYEDGLVTGAKKGSATVEIVYRGDGLKDLGFKSIFSSADTVNYNKKSVYPFEVIDGLSLNSTLLTLYEGETYQLLATVTDSTVPVIWTTSDDSKVTVTQTGLITAKDATEPNKPVQIAATQMINGVVKKIVCRVHVQPAVEKITLEPAEKTIEIEEFLTIEAHVEPEIQEVNLKWISSDPEVVAISTSANRSVTVQGIKGGSAVITAINAENIVVGHCKVIVNQPAEELILSAGGKNLSDGEEVRVPWSDKTFQLYAEILPEETTNKEVTWKSSNPKLATVDEHGLVTFNKSGKAGEVTIIVQSKDNPNLVKTCTIRILASVNGVELDQHELNLFVGESERLTYLVNPDDVANKTVTWTSFDTSIAAVDKTGMVTAKGPGKTQIMIMTEDGSFYDLCTVTVDLYATSVKMNYKKVTMNRGDYFDMEVTVAPANSTVKSLIWESLNPSVVTVSSNGRLTARNVGTAIVMVKTQTGSLAYCEVTVLEPMVSLELDETDITIDVDEKFLLTPEFSPEEPSNTEVKWSTSDEDIAEVNLLGEVTGISGGTVVITCETVDGGYRAFCLVTVEEPVYELTVTPDNYRLGIGKTYQLTATMTNKGTATDSEIIWSSSDESICTVDKFGKITGVNFGYATIKAEAADGYGAYATCEVRVVREVTSIRLNYYRIQLVQGETVSLRAEIQPSNATYNTAQFVSDDLTVAVVDEDGLITGITPGTTWVHANAKDNSGVSAACFVEVIAPIPATGVTVSDKEIVLVPGESKEVIASIRPANSTDDLTWSSGNEFIATVDSNGKITARMVGTTDVTVMTTSGKTATVKVIVLGLSRSTLEMPVYTQYSRLVVDGANAPVRWDVEDTTICEIANGVVTARKVGTTYVTATINGRTLKCKIIVSPNKKK